jgi:hypothetical protein
MRRRAIGGWLIATVVLTTAGCASSDERVVVREADDVQVMTPEEVAVMREEAADLAEAPAADGATAATVPQNQDDRPAEVRLFEAFSGFRSCLADDGYEIEGNLLDRNNPAFQDPAYVESLQKCAARTKIAEIYQEMQSNLENMTPEQVEERNEGFVLLQECLERRGWIIETTTNEIGLINPTTFTNAEGELDERDIQQCASEQDLGL